MSYTAAEFTEKYDTYFICTSITAAVLTPVAVVGNALVLTAILRNPPTNILLATMAFTDFGTGIITQPFYVVLNFPTEKDDFKLIDMTTWPRIYSILKQMVDGLGNYLVILTVLTITTMSIERWLHMSYRTLVTVRRAYIAVGVLLPLPIPLAVCRALYPFNIVVNVTSAFFFLFCLVITSVAYFKVFRIIRAHQQQIHSSELAQNGARPAIHMAKYRKSVFTILYIVAIFIICFLPMAIFSSVLMPVLLYKKEMVTLYNASVIWLFISSSLNPSHYLWRMTCTYPKLKL